MDRRDARGDLGERQFFLPFCRAYREDRNCDEACKRFDAEVAVKYYLGEMTGPALYRCYMQLWDMTYPLWISSRLLGVVFAGQIVVKGEEHSWRQALSEVDKFVRWGSFDEHSPSQINDVCAQTEGRVREPLKTKLATILREDGENKNADVRTLLQRWTKFQQFGRMLESLLSQSYERTMSGARERILHEIGVELLSHQTSQESWWQAVAAVTRALKEVAGTGQIDVYSRAGSRYIQRVSGGEVVSPASARRVPVGACFSIPTDILTRVGDVPGGTELQQALGTCGDGYVYRCDYKGLDVRSISTILVLEDQLPSEEMCQFATAFCHGVGLRADVRELLFQIDTDRRVFSDQARRAAHTSRMPLEIALSHIELGEANRERGAGIDYAALMSKVKEKIFDSETNISEILARAPRPRRSVDIRQIVAQLVEDMKPLAARRSCWITPDLPSGEVPVRISEAEIRVALRNLLDNAIKYSFTDHEVRVRMTVDHGNMVLVFGNFGVGIPEDRLKAIRDLGERGEVRDPRLTRGGFGIGLSVAIREIEAHGGSLDIESYPADQGSREPSLRFVTKVTVTLPLSWRLG
jgi:signal transduction histidine kinase